MEHSASNEITFHHEAGGDEFIKKVIKTTVLLSVITIIELGLGLAMYAFPMAAGFKLFLKGVIVILSLAKAFYIVGIFMHLGDELKNLIMTICVPLMLFVWFIAAFLMDGNSWKNLRNSRGKSIVPIEHSAPAAHH
jgi:cytochrome c oxidase subunit IV